MATATDSILVLNQDHLYEQLDRDAHLASDGLWVIDRFCPRGQRQPIIRFRTMWQWLREDEAGFGFPFDTQADFLRWVNDQRDEVGYRSRLITLRETDTHSYTYVLLDRNNSRTTL